MLVLQIQERIVDNGSDQNMGFLENQQPVSMLKLSEVVKKVRLGASTIYRKMDADEFPIPVRLGASVRWYEHEIDEYLINLPRTKEGNN
jgi:prophage regulatory protein